MKKRRSRDQTIDEYILQTTAGENPETIEQLVKLIHQKFHFSDEEILRHILLLQSEGKITLKKTPVAATKSSTSVVSSKAYWYWATLVFTGVTAVLALQIPENAYPLVYTRYIFGSFLVLLLPGYTLIKALFSAKKLDTIERIGLSIGMSIALVCLDAFLLNFTPWRITVLSLVLSLSLLIVVFATIAILRERQMFVGENREP